MILESANETSGMNSHRYQELETFYTPQSSSTGQRPANDWPGQGYLCNVLGSSRMVGMIGLVLSDYLGGCVAWPLALCSKTERKGDPLF
jgi:hypothetical protein